MPKLQLTLQKVSVATQSPAKIQFFKWAKAAIRVDTEVTIRIVDANEGRLLNSTYRGKNYATNVLTFSIAETPHLTGDIILCAPVVEAEAAEQGKTIMAHYAHLTVHGILHLHGYDHVKDAPAELMEWLEVTILQKLGYASPYLITEDIA